MARQRTIVGLGEAVLREHPDRTEPAGLAASVAMQAVRLSHRGVVISRIGQDEQASELLALLRDAGVDTTHIQSDPDLPTARIIVRAIGPTVARYLESRAAFDNLQSDFDLEDVAQQADAVVFGLLTRRGAQTRSEENRFLAACNAAVKVFDLTNRADEQLSRRQALMGLELADAAVCDSVSLSAILPGAGDKPAREQALELMRSAGISFLLTAEPAEDGQRITLHAADRFCDAAIPAGRASLFALLVALLHGVLKGRDFEPAMELAARVGNLVAHEPVPEQWLQ